MQGALYFPYIQVPVSPWFTRSLLYWDVVGTIVPDTWIDEPEELGKDTLDMVRRGLVRQAFPHEVAPGFSDDLGRWLESLSNEELAYRRACLAAGEHTELHVDKWLTYEVGVEQLISAGLGSHSPRWNWLSVERRTANEFMAALALALCRREGILSISPGFSWTPATDDPTAFQVLMAGLENAKVATPADRNNNLRLRGQLQATEVRTSFLERALPMPAEPVSTEKIERFRRRHGDSLPRCRRHIQAVIDRTLALDDVGRVRVLDRVAEGRVRSSPGKQRHT